MTISNPLSNLSLFDILSNLVPGTLLIIITSGLFSLDQFAPGDVPSAALIALLSGYILGHIIQAIGSLIFSEQDVGDAIESFSKDDVAEESPLSSVSLIPELNHLIKQRFELPSDYTDYDMLNRLVLTQLERNSASRALRFQILGYFYRNLVVVSIFTIVLSLVAVGMQFAGIDGVRNGLHPALFAAGGLVSLPLFHTRMRQFNQRFVEYAIAEFYAIETDSK